MPAVQKWLMPSRVSEKRQRKADQEANWRKVCAAVTKREAGHCRICGLRADPSAVGMLRHGEHHHIVFRSAGGADHTSNVALLCGVCHHDIHAGKLRVEGNADECLTVWRRTDEGWHQVIRETNLGGERD
jgi:hypothetical protein